MATYVLREVRRLSGNDSIDVLLTRRNS